jgi:capsular polysaccharide biosynthesis protein
MLHHGLLNKSMVTLIAKICDHYQYKSYIYTSVMGRSLSYKGYRFLCKMVKTYKNIKKSKKILKTNNKQINTWDTEVLNIKGFRAHHGFLLLCKSHCLSSFGSFE